MTSDRPTEQAGIITKDSPLAIEATIAKLTGLLHARGMKIFAVIDQSAEARDAGLELRPTTLVVFGNPAAGTAVMEAAPLAAMDLPLKVLVWVDRGQTRISYVSPGTLADRYDLDADLARNLAGIDPLTDALVAP
jgi:uncharacterized protein (DUF302 family)